MSDLERIKAAVDAESRSYRFTPVRRKGLTEEQVKAITSCVGFGLVVAVVLFIFIGSDAGQKEPAAPPKPIEVIPGEFDAASLMRECAAQPVRMWDRYWMKRMSVSGVATYVDGSSNYGAINLGTGRLRQPVRCRFKHDVESMAHVRVGDRVVIQGTCWGFGEEGFSLNDCELVRLRR